MQGTINPKDHPSSIYSRTYNTGTLDTFASFWLKFLPFSVLHTFKHTAWKAKKSSEIEKQHSFNLT
jgi:hypothetical protein